MTDPTTVFRTTHYRNGKWGDDGPDESAVAVVEAARTQGIHIIKASYEGGSDEGYTEVVEAMDAQGASVEVTGEIQGRYRPQRVGDALAEMAVDRHFGGFSGTGDGTRYWGVIEMRLDTFQTREIHEGGLQEITHDHPDAPWQ